MELSLPVKYDIIAHTFSSPVSALHILMESYAIAPCQCPPHPDVELSLPIKYDIIAHTFSSPVSALQIPAEGISVPADADMDVEALSYNRCGTSPGGIQHSLMGDPGFSANSQ